MTGNGLFLIEPQQVAAIVKKFKGCSEDKLWRLLCLAEWLHHLRVFNDAQVVAILTYARPGATLLAVGDSRFVTFVLPGGLSPIYDVDEEKIVEQTAQCVTTVVLDIQALMSLKGPHNGRLASFKKDGT